MFVGVLSIASSLYRIMGFGRAGLVRSESVMANQLVSAMVRPDKLTRNGQIALLVPEEVAPGTRTKCDFTTKWIAITQARPLLQNRSCSAGAMRSCSFRRIALNPCLSFAIADVTADALQNRILLRNTCAMPLPALSQIHNPDTVGPLIHRACAAARSKHGHGEPSYGASVNT
jgi:hypothetical protein